MIGAVVASDEYQYKPGKVYVDSARPDFIRSLKSLFNENTDYESAIQRAKHDKVDYENRMYVVPVSFSEFGRDLLGRFQNFVSKGWFSVSPIEHKELVTQMRMARYKENGNLDKEEIGDSTFDSLDATRLALFQFETAGRRYDR